MSWQNILIGDDGRRLNLASRSGVNIELVKKVWQHRFGKSGYKIRLSSIPFPLVGPSIVIDPAGKPFDISLKKALKLGPGPELEYYAEAIRAGVQPLIKDGVPESCSTEGIQRFLDRKFPGQVKALASKRKGKKMMHKIQRLSDGRIAILSMQQLRDRSLLETLFEEDTKTAVKKHHQAAALTKGGALVSKRLQTLGVADRVVLAGVSKVDYTFEYTPTKETFCIAPTRFWYDTKDKAAFMRRVVAWFRWNTREPVAYLDSEWRAKILKASNGNVTAKRYVPKDRGTLGHLLTCTRCNLDFRKRHLFSSKHAVIRCPECDAKQSKNYSRQGVNWLEDLERRFNIKIQKATDSKGEKAILLNTVSTRVDGYSKQGNVVFEFHGSRWHGNPLLFYADDHPSPYSELTTRQLLMRTIKREEEIQKAGYNLIRIWDQDFLNEERYARWLLANSPRLKRFLSQP